MQTSQPHFGFYEVLIPLAPNYGRENPAERQETAGHIQLPTCGMGCHDAFYVRVHWTVHHSSDSKAERAATEVQSAFTSAHASVALLCTAKTAPQSAKEI